MRSYKTLLAWQLARDVTTGSLRLRGRWWTHQTGVLLGQLERAALSTQLNIAEGFALATTRQFLHHLRIAYGSAVEASEILDLLANEKLIDADTLRPMIANNARCQRLLIGLIHKLQK